MATTAGFVIDKVKEAGKAYSKFVEYQRKDNTKTQNEKSKEKKAFFESYRPVMEKYEQEGARKGKDGETKETGYSKLLPFFGKKDAKAFIAAYYEYIRGGEMENAGQNPIQQVMDTVKRKTDYANGEEEEQQENENEQGLIVPQPLSGKQRDGMNQIAQWMVRNSAKKDDASSFVLTFIMNQPTRLKLLAYYLIETGSRRATDSMGILNSQGYVPDLVTFKKKMIATKFKFWKRFSGSEIYWDKLGDAMRTALSCKPIMIKMYGSQEMSKEENTANIRPEQADEEEQNDAPIQEQQNQINEERENQNRNQEFLPPEVDNGNENEGEPENNNLPGVHHEEEQEEDEEAGNENIPDANQNARRNPDDLRQRLNNELSALDRVRTQKLTNLLRAIQEYDRAHKDQKSTKRQAGDEDKQPVLDAFTELTEADRALEQFMNREFGGNMDTEKLTGSSGPVDSEKTGMKAAGTYNSYISQAFGEYKGVAKILSQFKVWKLDENESLLKGKIEEVLGLAMAPIKLINLFISIKDFSKNTKDLTVAGKIESGLDIINNAAGLASTGITSAHNIQQWMAAANFASGAAKISPAVSGTLGVVTGGTQLLLSGTKTAVGLKKSSDINDTRKSLEALKENNLEDNPDNQFEDTEYEMTGEALEVERENNTTANALNAVKALAGATNVTAGVLTLTGVGAAAGAILGAIGSTLTLAATIGEYFANRNNRIKAVNTYMGISSDQKVNQIGDSIAAGMPNAPPRASIPELETSILREKIRNTVMHRMGYMSTDSFYTKVCMDYAKVLHRGLFRRRTEIMGDNATEEDIYTYDQVENKLTDKEKLYAKMLFNIRLNPKFSKNIENCTPSKETIATKLKP